MSTYVNCQFSWTDNSSGSQAETGQEIDIYTDSPSFSPNVPVNYTEAHHPWMRLKPIAAGVVSAAVQLATPVTFVTVRVRQFNDTGYGAWNNPAGVRFAITQPGGANVPPAPTQLGFNILDSGIVTPPPPPPPPTNPPPPPPPTGGGGSASNYVFTDQYSGVQGQSGWSYLDGGGSNLSFNTVDSVWRGSDSASIWQGGFHPATILRWTAPAAGTALVSGTYQLYDAVNSNGVVFTIKHNAATIHGPQTITTAIVNTISESVVMVGGDTLDFIITSNGSDAFDSTGIAPTIQFTTDGSTPANPTVSSVSPTTFTVPIGGTQALTVTLTSAALVNSTVSLSSSDVTKITVPASIVIPVGNTSGQFVATGVAAGSSTITATYNSSNKTSVGTAAAQISGTFTNAPAGGTTLLDHAFNIVEGPNMWDVYKSLTIQTDATAPMSPPNCLRSRMEALASSGGGQLIYTAPSSYRTLYFGLYWRTNAQFQGGPVGNKLFFLMGPGTNGVLLFGNSALNNGSHSLIWAMNTMGLDNSHITGTTDPGNVLWPNVNDGTVSVGVWYRIEVLIQASTTRTSRDGIIRWWKNGTLVGNYTTVNYCGANGETLNEWQLNNTWNPYNWGNTFPWEHWLDHLLIVGKN